MHPAVGESPVAGPNGGLGNVEGGCLKAPGGKLLGVVTESTADGERRLPGGWEAMPFPEVDQVRTGGQVFPGNDAFAAFPFPVAPLKPPRRAAPAATPAREPPPAPAPPF